ncbi:MAG: glycosyl hydrolase [Limisphaerales bacterium]
MKRKHDKYFLSRVAKITLLSLGLAWLGLVFNAAALPTDSLESGFLNPPDSARPQTWWHWMNGNITQVGIADDLKAMKQIGLGGATIVNVDCGIPAGPVNFMSPEWQDDFKFAVQQASRLGLKISVGNGPGWSNSGGPWITVTNAMQRVTTTELELTGPTNFNAALPQPPTKLDFYRDIAVLAFPAPDDEATISNIDAKDGQNGRAVLSSPKADNSTAGAVQLRKIIDLTSKLNADGKLRWRVPRGQWVILRVGYTPTGVEDHPAPKGGEGLECDKLSQAGMDAHWSGFMQKAIDDAGPLAGKTFDGSLIDSYEVGGQNWTKNFREEFKKRRGYDPIKFLPVFTGQVVDNPEVSERFLWDVRRTIADLFAENYFGHFSELCREHGFKSEIEPYTGPFESLQSGASSGEVMGEFWAGSQGNPSIKLAASVAHIYGKTIVGAESFTANPAHGKWQNYPYELKPLGDLMFCQGLNRYTFHRYAMQPWTNRWPGMTMGQWGIHLDRTETWWTQGKAWMDYITRCEFLLQQGRAVEDAAYFDGQSAPVETRVGNPPMPPGYDYDAIDADVLMHGATVKNGRLTLASGANYAVLILPPDDINMTPQMLECLRKLVRAGATILGPRPQHSPSLADYPKCDKQVKKLAHKLWGKCDDADVQENTYGKGHVVWGKSLADVFAEQNLKPDFEFHGASANTDLAYAHRVDGNTDIYFVSNQRRQFDSAECTFRVSGKIPELWHPDTGAIEPAPVWSVKNGRTTVRLNFDPAGSVFVIFRHATDDADHIVAVSGNFAVKSTSPKLKIQRAIYAVPGVTNELDVTAKLSQMVRGGQLDVVAANDTFGNDPAPHHRKELRVDYTLDGKPGRVVVPENETLTLPASQSISQPPQWETSIAADGSPTVTAWSDGRVELKTADGKVLHANATDLPAPQEITGAWNLSFPPNWGAPPAITLDKLISWTDSTNTGVRYFSGTATYEKEIEIPANRLTAGRELWLDLGAVKDFAEVSLNGHDFGVLWKPPFRVNVTAAAKSGMNKLIVKVTNLWPNRLIGDEQLPPDCEWNGKQLKAWPQWLLDGKPSPTGRLTFTTWRHYTKDSPLLESGLIGPVTLRTAETVSVN